MYLIASINILLESASVILSSFVIVLNKEMGSSNSSKLKSVYRIALAKVRLDKISGSVSLNK